MVYKFESKRDKIYFDNYLELQRAIEDAGGNFEIVIKEHSAFLDILARNSIELKAKYTLPLNERSRNP
jgi:hypothetical protein